MPYYRIIYDINILVVPSQPGREEIDRFGLRYANGEHDHNATCRRWGIAYGMASFFFFFELFPKRMNVKKKQVVEAIEKKGKLARWDVYIRFILE